MSEAATTAAARVTIVNEKGLHARASAKVARIAAEFSAAVTISHEGQSASARSIMDMLMLVAHQGCEVGLEATGDDAPEAVAALRALIADGFGELDDE